MTDDEKVVIIGPGSNYLLQSQVAMEIMNRERLLIQIMEREKPMLIDDTIWVNGERVRIDPAREVDFTGMEVRYMVGNQIIIDDYPHRLTGDELRSIYVEKEPRKPDNRHWVQGHPRSPRRGRK